MIHDTLYDENDNDKYNDVGAIACGNGPNVCR